MKLKQTNKIEEIEPTLIYKRVTYVADKGKLMTYQQIRKYCTEIQNKLPEGSRMTVTGLNIERFTNLYSSYNGNWKTNEEYDDYLGTILEDPEKFNAFFNFTVTIRTDTTKEYNVVKQKQIDDGNDEVDNIFA